MNLTVILRFASNQSIIILLMHKNNKTIQQQIQQILEKPYEMRSIEQHRLIVDIIKQTIPLCSLQRAKQLSFFARIGAEANNELQKFTSFTIFLTQHSSNSLIFQFRQLFNCNQSIIEDQRFAIIIDGKDVQKCQNLDNNTIEDQILFLHKSDYFEDVLKKRLFAVIRNAQILKFSFGQTVFKQNDKFDHKVNSGIYMVRQGQFCFSKNDQNHKNIQIFSFKKGYIFGHQTEPTENKNLQQFLTQNIYHNFNRKFTVSCKSSIGVVYRFCEQFFNSYLLKFCESLLKHNKKQLDEFFQKHFLKISKKRQQNEEFLSQKIIRSSSAALVNLKPFTAQRLSFSRQGARIQKQQIIEDIKHIKVTFQQLKDKLPKRSKLFAKQQLIKMYFNPEQKQSDFLLWKKTKCQKTRQLTRPNTTPLTRAEIFFTFNKCEHASMRSMRRSSKV